ncbi:MAG: hypothetical protein IT381_27365 [Deltaproteobacteria bacterium]|nr:hypothetical protein [Deltaproteobacteria bacterium]
MTRAPLCALLLLTLAPACARNFKPTLTPKDTIGPRDYGTILDLWTRTDQAFLAFEHKITVKATMITPMLRLAYAARFPEVYGYGGQVTRSEMKDAGTPEETLNFFVACYTAQFKWNDLHKTDSIWHVSIQRLQDGSKDAEITIDARAIEKVKIDENMLTIYPYLTPFDSGYIVRFPLSTLDGAMLIKDGRNRLRMRIASSFAEAAMQWELEP